MTTTIAQRNKVTITGVYYLGFIGLGLTSGAFGPTLQGLAQNTGSTLAQISSLFLARSLGYLIGTLVGGRIYDRVKGHPVISSVLVLMTLTMWCIPLLRSIYLLAALLFVLGLNEGLLDVGSNTLLLWLHGDRVPPFMNGLHAFWGVGTTIAPLVVAWVLRSTTDIAWSYWILGLLLLPSALALLRFPSPRQSAVNPALENSGNVRLVPLVLSILLLFLYVGSELGFGNWIYTYTTQIGFADPAIAAGVNSAFWLGFTLSRLLSIPLAARLRPNQILMIDLVGAIFCLSLVAFFPAQPWILWTGSIGAGVFMASVFPTILNDAQTRMHMSGNVTSWFFVGASLGGMLLPFMIGQFIEPFGPRAVILAVLGAMIGCLLLFTALLVVRTSPPPTQARKVNKVIERIT